MSFLSVRDRNLALVDPSVRIPCITLVLTLLFSAAVAPRGAYSQTSAQESNCPPASASIAESLVRDPAVLQTEKLALEVEKLKIENANGANVASQPRVVG